jgi:hypothetical protein
MHGGVDGNERLTARTAIVLLVLLALEGATLVSITQLVLPHVFLGFLLIPPVVLKLGSTGWRMLSYYRGRGEYVRRGPPHPLMRLVVAPAVVLSTIGLFATGVAVVATGSQGLLLGLHKASFVVWVGAMSAHVLFHVWKLPRLAFDRIPGRGLRLAALGATLAAGLALAVVTVPLADHWQDHATSAIGIDAA